MTGAPTTAARAGSVTRASSEALCAAAEAASTNDSAMTVHETRAAFMTVLTDAISATEIAGLMRSAYQSCEDRTTGAAAEQLKTF